MQSPANSQTRQPLRRFYDLARSQSKMHGQLIPCMCATRQSRKQNSPARLPMLPARTSKVR